MKKSWIWLMAAVLTVAAAAGAWSLNAQEPPARQAHRSYQLRHAKAADLAPKLRAMLGSTNETEILVDRRANRILVRGDTEAYQIASQLINTLDRPPQPAAKPTEPSVVRGYPVGLQDLDAKAEQIREKFPNARVATDNRTGQLLVVAPPSQQSKINDLLKGGATPTAPAEVSPPNLGRESFQLNNLSWRDFEQRLRDLWEADVTFSVRQDGEVTLVRMPKLTGNSVVLSIDRRMNRVVFSGPDGLRQYWRRVITAMDSTQLPERRTAVMPLEKADPLKIQRVVDVLRKAAINAAQGRATGALNVAAAAGGNRLGGDIASMIFQARPAPGQPPVGNQNAPGNQPPGNQQPGNQPPGNQPPGNQPPGNQPPGNQQPGGPTIVAEETDSGLIGDVQIEFIPELGMIIIRGHRRDVQKVREIIKEIQEKSTISQPDVVVYPLEHVNSQALADLINPIYEEIYEPRQGAVSITALGTPNAVLLIGRKDNVEVVQDLIKQLDQPVPPDSVVKVFPLLHKPAVDMANDINTIFGGATTGGAQPGVQQPQGGGGTQTPGAGLSPRVNVIADYRSNSVIVQAGPRDMVEIQELIKKLDIDAGPARMEVRVFALKNALADTMQQVLTAAITGQSTTVGQPGQPGQPGGQGQGGGATGTSSQPSVQIITVDQQGNKIVESGILAEVSITADANTNSLVVRAPTRSMELIQALIDQLDKAPEAESQIKVFEVLHGDATNLTVMLQELFGLDVTAGQQGVFSRTVGTTFGSANFNLGQTTGGGETTLIPLRFTPEPRTNSIIASGSSDDLNIVEALLVRLDEEDLRGRRTQVYRLNNASAEAVSLALQTILTNQQQLYQTQVNQQFSTIGQYEFLNQQVFVQPEINSNSIIVSATPDYFNAISEVIADLDRRPPMVLIQVVLAEMTLEADEETGAELGLQDSLLFDRGLGLANPIGYAFTPSNLPNGTDAGSLATRELLAGQAYSAFNLGRSSAANGFPGLVLTASNESVSVLIRMLEQSGRLQVLSRPQIMTLHNVPASLLVGQRVPRVADFQNTGTGGTVNTVVLDEVGLRLGVIPRVTPDGLIVMDLEVSKSAVGPVEQGIPIGVQDGVAINSPIFSDTTAITTLTARDKQTIVFSGLITKERADAYRGVPFISSIPIIGRLFRFDSHAERRTELLIFMTPHIVYSGSFEHTSVVNSVESARMSWCLADLIEMHGDVGMSPGRPGVWSPKECPTIYPHGDPTGALAEAHMIEPRQIDAGTPDGQIPNVPVPEDGNYISPGDRLRPNRNFVVPPNQREPNRPFILPGSGQQPTERLNTPPGERRPDVPSIEPPQVPPSSRRQPVTPPNRPNPPNPPAPTPAEQTQGPVFRPQVPVHVAGPRANPIQPTAYRPGQPGAYRPANGQPRLAAQPGPAPAARQPNGRQPIIGRRLNTGQPMPPAAVPRQPISGRQLNTGQPMAPGAVPRQPINPGAAPRQPIRPGQASGIPRQPIGPTSNLPPRRPVGPPANNGAARQPTAPGGMTYLPPQARYGSPNVPANAVNYRR